jgi:hypothetical protein
VVRERLEVLYDGREVELVACAGQAAQAHAFEAMVGLRCAKRISTPFLSSRDRSNSGVAISTRARSRASSFTSRGTLRPGAFGQHFAFKGQGSQSSLLANMKSLRKCRHHGCPAPTPVCVG